MKLNKKQVVPLILGAIDRLLRKDGHLLEADVSEQSIAGRIACYLWASVKDEDIQWDVDVEYNRHYMEPKRVIKLDEICPWHLKAQKEEPPLFRPDIVLHRRDTDDFNSLVVEIKKLPLTEDSYFDLCKLAVLTTQGDPPEYYYAYSNGLWLVINTHGGDPIAGMTWFRHGKPTLDKNAHDNVLAYVNEFIRRQER